MTITLNELLYLGLWTVLGGICGLGVSFNLYAEKKGPPYHKAWIATAIAFVICFILIYFIQIFNKNKVLHEDYGWIANLLALIGFLLPIWIYKASKRSPH